jgi:hypothetical protein
MKQVIAPGGKIITKCGECQFLKIGVVHPSSKIQCGMTHVDLTGKLNLVNESCPLPDNE